MKSVKKHLLIASALSLIAVTCAIVAGFNFSKAPSEESAKKWMKNLDDTASIATLSIPGTHDSGALYSLADVAGKCQDASIANQLDYGVRFLDIRLRAYNDSLVVCHGVVDERQTFASVLTSCLSFLASNSSETIIMSVKEEAKSISSTKTFENLLSGAMEGHEGAFYTLKKIPSLGQVRGKIVLLSRYKDSTMGIQAYDGWQDPSDASTNNTFTITNTDSSLLVQDHYKLLTSEDKLSEANAMASSIDKKITAMKSDTTLAPTFCLNFLSGYLTKGFPPSYSVPVAKYMNSNFVVSTKQQNMGVVLFDFVTPTLAKSIFTQGEQA